MRATIQALKLLAAIIALISLTIARASEVPDYRAEAANQIYSTHRDSIYIGQLPPLLYAVGVVQVFIDTTGKVSEVRWFRRPNDIVAGKIESLILSLTFDPPPEGSASFVETWLWDKSNKFQLLLLSNGQNNY